MKIVLIAGFSNEEVRNHLEFIKDRKLYHLLIRLFHLPARVGEFCDHAPWITEIISYMENNPDIELHVIGPHIKLKHEIETFQLRGVTYHFFREELSGLLRILNDYKLWKKLQLSGHYTKKILKEVQPDIVVLSGAENPVTSVSILYADQFPRLCLCQTIYNNPQRSLYSIPNKLIQAIEKDIFANVPFLGVYCKMHYELLQELQPDAIIFKYGYPSKGTLLQPTETRKEYDFVNFALQMDSRKGFPDAIQALAIVKRKFPNVKLNLVGRSSEQQKSKLVSLIGDLGLQENVSITPFFEKRSDMFSHIQKSRFALLPCKLDNVSGTMTQAMQLGFPMVVYKTTGTPNFNKEKDCVLIAEHSNIEDLAAKMLLLMEHPEKAEQLRQNALEYQEMRAEKNKANGDKLVENFKAVIAHYRDGQAIPQEQLFNPERDD